MKIDMFDKAVLEACPASTSSRRMMGGALAERTRSVFTGMDLSSGVTAEALVTSQLLSKTKDGYRRTRKGDEALRQK